MLPSYLRPSAVEAKATPENSKALEAAYLDYIAANPNDHETASRYLYRAAELQFRMNRYSGAIKLLNQALKDHYAGSNTPMNALFLGTIYKEKLKNEVAAAAVYQTFLQAFPNHEKAAAIKADYGNEPTMDAKIVDFGNRLMNDSTNRIDYRVANDFIGLCEINALMLPNDAQSGDYLHKAGETARSLRSFPKALEIYDWIILKYPNHPKAAQALFLKAFTYDNDLKKVEEARALYTEFLNKYPNDDFADDTKFLLENLGKNDEEIINSFGK
jgi:TolA-binding protein